MRVVNILYLCLAWFTIASGFEGSEKTGGNKDKRLTDDFVIGEKTAERNRGVRLGVREIKNYKEINAFSIIDVKLKKHEPSRGDDIFESMGKKGYIILFVADLKKKGEDTWHRISVINRYTREIRKLTQYTGDALAEVRAESTDFSPFYVKDVILSDNPFIRQGDRIQVLFFFPVKSDSVYFKDLQEARSESKPLASIDAQEMYLMTEGSVIHKYAAKDGDKIRLRFLRAEYSIKNLRDFRGGEEDGRSSEQEAFADIICIEDEMNFVFKEFGTKIDVSPILGYGSRVGDNFNSDNFNPMNKNPSFGSNVYFSYDGRDMWKMCINYLPGLHFSLLGLAGDEEAEFTAGLVWSLPSLRKWIGIFLGWHNLKDPVIGMTFSPAVDFRKLVQPEKTE